MTSDLEVLLTHQTSESNLHRVESLLKRAGFYAVYNQKRMDFSIISHDLSVFEFVSKLWSLGHRVETLEGDSNKMSLLVNDRVSMKVELSSFDGKLLITPST
jgi:hypothetical protein